MSTYQTPIGCWHQCVRCGHQWPSQVQRPQTCPKCKSEKWDIIPRKYRRREVK
jgi:predicted Zn-ribbon and HTH transcriptional regulator